MSFDKSSVEYRYVFDIDRGILHDLASPDNPNNEGCNLEAIENWVCFDTEKTPVKGAVIKKLTSSKEVLDIEVRELCSHCIPAGDSSLLNLLEDYFLTRHK